MSAILNGNTLTLSGDVGDFGFGDCFTYSDVLLALAQVDPSAALTVHVNSGGGYATEGAAIHALFAARPGTTDFVVEGIAASAASLIVMAGDVVRMADGSVLMIHDPASWTFGTVSDHEKTVAGLEALATAYARVYALKSGKSEAECRAIMKAERWLAPAEAVDEGFADETGAGKAVPVAAFDYGAYGHAPKKLTALAKRKNWTLARAQTRPAPRAAGSRPSTQETEMSNARQKGDDAGAQARREAVARVKTIMQSAEAEGRTSLAEHLAYETEMEPAEAEAIMAAAPKGNASAAAPTARTAGAEDRTFTAADIHAAMRTGMHPDDTTEQRLHGAGLNRESRGGSAPSGLVAAMKRRHNV